MIPESCLCGVTSRRASLQLLGARTCARDAIGRRSEGAHLSGVRVVHLRELAPNISARRASASCCSYPSLRGATAAPRCARRAASPVPLHRTVQALEGSLRQLVRARHGWRRGIGGISQRRACHPLLTLQLIHALGSNLALALGHRAPQREEIVSPHPPQGLPSWRGFPGLFTEPSAAASASSCSCSAHSARSPATRGRRAVRIF